MKGRREEGRKVKGTRYPGKVARGREGGQRDRKLCSGGDSDERLLPPESGLKLPASNECAVPLECSVLSCRPENPSFFSIIHLLFFLISSLPSDTYLKYS